MVHSATQEGYRHPLIGHVALIRDGAQPAGVDPSDPLLRIQMDNRRGTVTDVSSEEPGFPFGTVEVLGWYWDWQDLTVE